MVLEVSKYDNVVVGQSPSVVPWQGGDQWWRSSGWLWVMINLSHDSSSASLRYTTLLVTLRNLMQTQLELDPTETTLDLCWRAQIKNWSENTSEIVNRADFVNKGILIPFSFFCKFLSAVVTLWRLISTSN